MWSKTNGHRDRLQRPLPQTLGAPARAEQVATTPFLNDGVAAMIVGEFLLAFGWSLPEVRSQIEANPIALRI